METTIDYDLVKLEAKKELARRHLYDYCTLKYPRFYKPNRTYLKELCDTIESFVNNRKKRFLVINMPPRAGKSFTGKNTTEWLFGHNSKIKVMTGAYNEVLSTTFARQVRNTIDEKSTGGALVYADIFPDSSVKYGEASASMWSLEGMDEKSYLAMSPTGTATGFGANIIIIDDIIKNDQEAYNEEVLDKHWSWFANTMLQRTEGDDGKVIAIMTRWSTKDLAGRILAAYDDVEHVLFKAIQDDGTMLDDEILNRAEYDIKTKEMNQDIIEANYNQKPIDIQGRLYSEFKEWIDLPKKKLKKYNYTDTADKGTDFLCSVDFVEHDGYVYVTDLVMTDEGMEESEPEVARLLHTDNVDEATIESNNGGRGFARNIDRILRSEHNNKRCIVQWQAQTSNKEARILSSSTWVADRVLMPTEWKSKYPKFYQQVMTYQRKGKNKHDDAVDVLAAIYEKITGQQKEELDEDDVAII